MSDIPLSALDIAFVQTDSRPADTLRETAVAAQALERLGYHRIWYAEHHHAAAIGAFPPAVLTAHCAASTSAIRLGSGGVLAPNHAPISLAEQFGTLAALHPDRINMGIGRGPGTSHEPTARALRRGAGPATGAALAAKLGLPIAFAHHMRLDNTLAALERYQEDGADAIIALRCREASSTWEAICANRNNQTGAA